VEHDTELTADDLKALVGGYKSVYAEYSQQFPSDPTQQLRMATEAVFASWNNERAVGLCTLNQVDP
jgi:pyruvate,orthophosphate dikinase